jgi:hypothetical protein
MVEDLIKRLRRWANFGYGVNASKCMIEACDALEASNAAMNQANGAIEAANARIAEFEATRIAYASEFAPDAEGLPDVGSIHSNIRALKSRLTALESERDALLAAAGKEAVPAGWKLVPVEPTRAMCLAAKERRENYPIKDDADSPVVTYRAMLAAAPTAALENGDGRDAWISVDERMPDEDSVVLVSAWEYGKPDGKRFTLVARRSGSLFLNEETGDDLYTPTHWQPLPAPPAALSQKAGEQQ